MCSQYNMSSYHWTGINPILFVLQITGERRQSFFKSHPYQSKYSHCRSSCIQEHIYIICSCKAPAGMITRGWGVGSGTGTQMQTQKQVEGFNQQERVTEKTVVATAGSRKGLTEEAQEENPGHKRTKAVTFVLNCTGEPSGKERQQLQVTRADEWMICCRCEACPGNIKRTDYHKVTHPQGKGKKEKGVSYTDGADRSFLHWCEQI